ncbi:MAG TPA: class I adenylate-forming enzyme family protein [Acidimicrobiales bacterium]
MGLAELLFGDEGDGASLLVHVGGVDHSLDEVRARATAIAAALAGIEPGRPVGVMLPDGADLVATLFAVWRAGGAYVPLNPRLATADLAHVLGSVEPAPIVTTADHADRFPGRPVVVLGPGPDEPALRPGPMGGRRFDPGTALVQLTSGTTGRPKPVLLTHDGVLALLDNVIGTLRSTPSGSGSGRPAGSVSPAPPMPNLVPVSLSLWAGIYQVLFARRVGAPVVLMDGFDPVGFARLVERFGIRSTVLPPAAMAMLTADPRVTTLAPLRYVRSITAPLSPLQARRFHDRFGTAILNGYGQTEIGGEIVGWSAADWKVHGVAKLGSVGRPHAGVEVRSDPATGELQVRTPALSAGYADGGDLADRLTPDGWFRTGDVGRVDGDGFVWVEGRLGDMINRGGLKVSPAEVEEVLRLAPGVADAAVVGVPDDRLGEVPWAFVVPAPAGERAAGDGPPRRAEGLDAATLEARCREHLAPYKVPVEFRVVDALPRNEVGKVLGKELVAAAQAGAR